MVEVQAGGVNLEDVDEEAMKQEQEEVEPIDVKGLASANVKYCQVWSTWQRVPPIWIKHRYSPPEARAGFNVVSAGLIQWVRAFGGDIYVWYGHGKLKSYDGRLEPIEDFDYVHINLTGDGKDLPLRVRKYLGYNSKTKIVVNIDYGMTLWKDIVNFSHPEEILDLLDMCDYIFAVCPEMALLLELSLKRPVPCIPHPTDVKQISSFRVPIHQRKRRILVLLHTYDQNYFLPYFAFRDIDAEKVCINASSEAMGRGDFLYNSMIPHGELPFEMLVNPKLQTSSGIRGGVLAESYVAYDTYIIPGFGRFPVECAAVGVPCVGGKGSFSQSYLFPQTTSNVFSIGNQKRILERLFNDSDFYKEVVDFAWNKCQEFSLERSRENMLAFWEGREFKDYKLEVV